MLSSEIIIKRHTTDCSIVWDGSNIPVYRYARSHMEKQQKPLKVVVGCDFTICKPKPKGDMNIEFLNDDEEANEGYRGNYTFMDLNVSTKNMSVYTPDTMN